MKINNKKSLVLSKIYNIFFITSFIISLIFFLIFIIITVNIKFLIYPQLIPNILSLFSSIDYLYEYFFCNPSNRFYFVSLIAIINDLYFVLSIFISTMLIYYLNKKYNKFILYKILNSVVFLILFLFTILFCKQNFVSFITAYIFLILFFYSFTNFILKDNSIFIKFFILIPFINLILLPIKTINYIRYKYFNAKEQNRTFLTISFLFLFLSILTVSVFPIANIMGRLVKIYSPEGTYYIHDINNKVYYISYNNITFLKNDNFLSALPKTIEELEAYNLLIEEENFKKEIKFKFDIKTEIQDLEINSERNEMYLYDGVNNKLLVLDYSTGEVKKEKKLEDKFFFLFVFYDNITGERMCFDNDSQTIAIALEYSYFYIFDMNTLDIIRCEHVPIESDSVIFNKQDNSYLLSFWTTTPYIISCPIDSQKEMKKISTPICQGELEYSDKNKELYLPLHQQGQIYVYDAVTYTLKRKIKVRYGVKNVSYNEQYNILLASSYLSGYIDIISLNDVPNKIIYSKFIHWHLRKPLLYNNILYVPTMAKIYKYDVKYLLEKLKHEE